jgi:thiamine-monophosphate kinase
VAALRALATDPAARGFEDDAAVLEVGGEALVLTHDMMVEGRHWLAGQDMADVAWKLVAVNLSDLAAKGAEPLGVLLGHTLGAGDQRFLVGLREVLETHRVPLLGGDTVAGDGARTLGCTAIGRAAHCPVPSRAGARRGDRVYVTGPLGAAMLGYEALREGSGADSLAFRRPIPRLAEGRALAPLATAMMDISDGLLLDAWRMARASGVSLVLEGDTIPAADPSRRDACVRWGDDYELLFTAPPDRVLPVPAHPIGMVEPQGAAPLVLDGVPLTDPAGLGYQHG